jgi:hypothetical protein
VVLAELRRWSSSSIACLRWVTDTSWRPTRYPVGRARLTRSVRRARRRRTANAIRGSPCCLLQRGGIEDVTDWKDLQSAKPVAGRASMMNDIDVLWYGIDRTFRETALKTEELSRTLRDVQSGVTAYRTQHAKLLEYVRTTTDDLRSRLVERQNCDAYQWALLISTHEQRHVLQIREIRAHPKYPKG